MEKKITLTHVLEVKLNNHYRVLFASIGFEIDGTGYLKNGHAPVEIDTGNQRYGSDMFTGLNYWNYFLGEVKKEDSKIVLPNNYQYGNYGKNIYCEYGDILDKVSLLKERFFIEDKEVIPQYMYVFPEGSVKQICYDLADKCGIEWLAPCVCVTSNQENFRTFMRACYGRWCDFCSPYF